MSLPITTTDTYYQVDDDDDFGSVLDEDQPDEDEDDEQELEDEEEHEYEDADEEEEEEEYEDDEDDENCSTGVCNTRMVAPIAYATPIPAYNPGTIYRPPQPPAVQLVIDDEVARASPPRIPNVVHMQQVPRNALDAAQIPTFKSQTPGIPQPYTIPTMVRPGGLVTPVGGVSTRPPGVQTGMIPTYNAGVKPPGITPGIPQPIGVGVPKPFTIPQPIGVGVPTPFKIGAGTPQSTMNIPQPGGTQVPMGIPQPIGGKPPSPFRIGIPMPISQQVVNTGVQPVFTGTVNKTPSPLRIGVPVSTGPQLAFTSPIPVQMPTATPPMIRIGGGPPTVNIGTIMPKPFSPPVIRTTAPPSVAGVQLPGGGGMMPKINVPAMTPFVINVNQSKNFKELLIREAEETDAIFQFRSFVAQELATIPLSDIEGLEGKILSPDTIILASQLITKKKWFKISYSEDMNEIISMLISLSPGLGTHEIE
jgi:hypothetical protein